MWNPQAAGIIKQKRWMQPYERGTIDSSARQKATVTQNKAFRTIHVDFIHFLWVYQDLHTLYCPSVWTFGYLFAFCRNKTGYAHIHSTTINSIQKTLLSKGTSAVSKKSTGIVHKAILHCTRPYHTRPYQSGLTSMPWRSRCGTHKLLALSYSTRICTV